MQTGRSAEQRARGKGSRITEEDRLSHGTIGAAIEVHKELGPGLLENAYRECLAHEFTARGLPFEREKALAVRYKGLNLECGYRLDFLVGGLVVVELKTVQVLLPLHMAQVLTYLRLAGCKLGLLINWHVEVLRDGIRRVVLGL